jgi:hypothetical protein
MTVAPTSNCPLSAHDTRGVLLTCDCEAIREISAAAATLVDETRAAFETTRLRADGCVLHFRFHKLGNFPGDGIQIEVFLVRPECGSTWTRFAESLVFDEGDDLDPHVERAATLAQRGLRRYQDGVATQFATLAV